MVVEHFIDLLNVQEEGQWTQGPNYQILHTSFRGINDETTGVV